VTNPLASVADLHGAPSGARPLILHIQNDLYRRFLESRLASAGRSGQFVDLGALAGAISQVSDAVLVLQSDEEEHELIEIAARLKRLFGDRLRILLLSADHLTAVMAKGVVDAFVQYPVAVEELMDVVDGGAHSDRSVLLIDDSKLIHSTIVGRLEEAGFKVHQAFDGVEGVEMARRLKPRAIICDIEMPRLNGFDACAQIRNAPENRDVHIIMSSTLGSAVDQQRGFEVGVDEYITKPVVMEELIDRLDRALRQSGAARENILILEQDETLAKRIAQALAKQGFRTHLATSIEQALKMLARISCDVAVCEIGPRDGSIIDFFKGLRVLRAERRPEALILASRENRADTRMVMNAGAAGVISKPFSADKLLALTERVLADRRAQRERAQLQRYVSKASLRMALEKSVMSGATATARADRKRSTVLFSDIVSFTSRCERYPPQQVVEQVNTMFDVMTRVIMESGGDIDKFMGDACMAFWLDEGSDAFCRNALDAVLRLRLALKEMNETSKLLSADPIAIRIGLNTGDVILCDIGAVEARVDLTIISDAVNLASRFESAAKQYGVDNLISESTLAPVRDAYAARIIDRVRVKGKESAACCFELFNARGKESARERELIETFDTGFAAYSAGDFARAEEYFKDSAALEANPRDLNPSQVYLGRCADLRANPRKDWDGVWSLATK
jgi:DNA-binding response OmpR family regulator